MEAGKRVLVTGFGPFATVVENPSQRMVERLAASEPRDLAGLSLTVEVLPVSYAEVGARLPALLAAAPYDAVLLTGVRRSADLVCVERVALNLDDSELPDADGVRRRGVPIDSTAPPAYISDLDLDRLVDAYAGAGEPAIVSNHAGAYLCNRAYFMARHALTARTAAHCVFVHLPSMPAPLDVGRMDSLAAGTLACARLLAAGARLSAP